MHVGVVLEHPLQRLLLDDLFEGIVFMLFLDMYEVLDRTVHLLATGALPYSRLDDLAVGLVQSIILLPFFLGLLVEGIDLNLPSYRAFKLLIWVVWEVFDMVWILMLASKLLLQFVLFVLNLCIWHGKLSRGNSSGSTYPNGRTVQSGDVIIMI
jgi:hypothetical protein